MTNSATEATSHDCLFSMDVEGRWDCNIQKGTRTSAPFYTPHKI
jgi:hypothetical protein